MDPSRIRYGSLASILFFSDWYSKDIENSFPCLFGHAHDFLLPAFAYFWNSAIFPKGVGSLNTKFGKAVNASAIFAGCSALEFAQYSGVYPGTHDALDYVAYAAGAFGAMGLDFMCFRWQSSNQYSLQEK